MKRMTINAEVNIIENELEGKNITAAIKEGLRNKVKDHNDKHGDKPGKRVNLRMLSAVFRRGVGAYRTNPGSVRPNVRSEEQWAYARVNAFLYAVRTGRFRGGKFDLDLLPSGHPLATQEKKMFTKVSSRLFIERNEEDNHEVVIRVGPLLSENDALNIASYIYITQNLDIGDIIRPQNTTLH